MARNIRTAKTQARCFELIPSTQAPADARPYQIYLADGVNWDPLGVAMNKAYLVLCTGYNTWDSVTGLIG